MSERTLFRVADDGSVTEIPGRRGTLGEALRRFVVRHMEAFLSARPVASGYATGRRGERIDALGLTDDGAPVVVQFERPAAQNLLGRGLYHLEWLDDHRAEFERLVLDRYGSDVAGGVDWARPRVVCVAGDFTEYDRSAAVATNPDVRLVRVVDHQGEVVEVETVAASEAAAPRDAVAPREALAPRGGASARAPAEAGSGARSGRDKPRFATVGALIAESPAASLAASALHVDEPKPAAVGGGPGAEAANPRRH